MLIRQGVKKFGGLLCLGKQKTSLSRPANAPPLGPRRREYHCDREPSSSPGWPEPQNRRPTPCSPYPTFPLPAPCGPDRHPTAAVPALGPARTPPPGPELAAARSLLTPACRNERPGKPRTYRPVSQTPSAHAGR